MFPIFGKIFLITLDATCAGIDAGTLLPIIQCIPLCMHRGDDSMNPIHQGLEGPSDVTKDEGDNEPLISKLEFDEEISLEGVPASFYTDEPDSNANIPVLGILLHRHGKVFDAELTTNEQPQCRICLDIGGMVTLFSTNQDCHIQKYFRQNL